MDYGDYQHLLFERRPNGVVLITFNRPEQLNATNDRLHWELTQVWLTFDADPDARVAVVTGKGRAFSAGGDLEMVEANTRDPKRLARTVREAWSYFACSSSLSFTSPHRRPRSSTWRRTCARSSMNDSRRLAS